MAYTDNIKNLYQVANEIRNTLTEENEKIKNLTIKNEAEINELRIKYNEVFEKLDKSTQILDKHTEI